MAPSGVLKLVSLCERLILCFCIFSFFTFYRCFFFSCHRRQSLYFSKPLNFSVTFLNNIEFGKGQQVNRTFQKNVDNLWETKKGIYFFYLNINFFCWYFHDYADHLKNVNESPLFIFIFELRNTSRNLFSLGIFINSSSEKLKSWY